MTDRLTVDTINSDQLDALYEQLEAAEQTESQRQLAVAQEALASATTRAARAEATIARVRTLVAGAADITAAGISDYDIGRHDLARAVLAALPMVSSAVPVPPTVGPSRRAGLRDEIAAALEAADYRLDMQRGDLADSIMPVLYREWPWLRAEAEDAEPADRAVAEPFPIWTVWREEQPAYGHFATEDIAKRASIDCWEEDEPACPDYSWRPDGGLGNWELLVGGERAEVYIRRHLVYGGLPQSPHADALRSAAERVLDADRLPFVSPMGRKDVAALLRRLADEVQPRRQDGASQ